MRRINHYMRIEAVLRSLIVFNMKTEESSSETSVIIRTTQRHIPEDGIFHSHRRENLKSYIALTGWGL
jgi:hypothetical protein